VDGAASAKAELAPAVAIPPAALVEPNTPPVIIDLCQFSVMINQLNLDARPRMLEEMGKRRNYRDGALHVG
jgi:hypothetical protein